MTAGWLDVTVPIHPDMVVYAGDPRVEVTPALALERGDPVNVARLALGSHTGTHVDAPRHLIPGGVTVDCLPLDVLLGPARVVAAPPGPIGPATVAGLAGERRVIFKTAGSARRAEAAPAGDRHALTLEAARTLVRDGVALVGIDGPSIEALDAAGYPVHRCLLEAGVVILEGLDLSAVPAGRYRMVCLPLRIRDGDGAPARVLLQPMWDD